MKYPEVKANMTPPEFNVWEVFDKGLGKKKTF
jgi:hypothetical protein